MAHPSWAYLNLQHPGKGWSEIPHVWGPCSGRGWMKWDRPEWCLWTDKPCPRRQRGENPWFHPKSSYSALYLANHRREASGVVFLCIHPFIQPYAVSFLLTWPFPIVQMVEKERTKNTDKNTSIPTCKSIPSWPLGLAGCAVSLKQAIWL